jgi:hypothetical protein
VACGILRVVYTSTDPHPQNLAIFGAFSVPRKAREREVFRRLTLTVSCRLATACATQDAISRAILKHSGTCVFVHKLIAPGETWGIPEAQP